MKQQLSFPNKLVNPGEKQQTLNSPSGPFCPLSPPREGKTLKGGALTSAFMSAFL